MPHATAGYMVADLDLHQIAAPQVTVDGKIEKRPIDAPRSPSSAQTSILATEPASATIFTSQTLPTSTSWRSRICSLAVTTSSPIAAMGVASQCVRSFWRPSESAGGRYGSSNPRDAPETRPSSLRTPA